MDLPYDTSYQTNKSLNHDDDDDDDDDDDEEEEEEEDVMKEMRLCTPWISTHNVVPNRKVI